MKNKLESNGVDCGDIRMRGISTREILESVKLPENMIG